MNCIKCNSTTSVVDSRPQESSAIKRRRKCGACQNVKLCKQATGLGV